MKGPRSYEPEARASGSPRPVHSRALSNPMGALRNRQGGTCPPLWAPGVSSRTLAEQDRDQGVVVDGLDQVVVEAGLAGAAPVLLLAVAGDGDDDASLQSRSSRSCLATS